MCEKKTLWNKLRHRFHNEMNSDIGGFLDWAVEQRLDYLAHNGSITSEVDLIAELTAELMKSDRELTASERTCLALFIDRVECEKQMVYQQGLLDGIMLMKAIRGV